MALLDDVKLVLIVEDDQWLRSLLADLLRDEDYDVLEAESGTEGLYLARSRVPDVVVLDLKLPGMSGLDVLGELRAHDVTANIPVIVVSGEVDELTRRALERRAQRADGVIEKPLDLAEFFSQVEAAAWA